MLDVHSFVDARIYKNDQEVIQDALRFLVRGRLHLRVRRSARHPTESGRETLDGAEREVSA